MALIKGQLLSFQDPLLGKVPTIVVFQYNPHSITRTFRLERPLPTGGAPGDGANPLGVAGTPVEELALTLELDATDGLERGGPLTSAFGISPRLAALEMLMQPVGSHVLGGAAASAVATVSQALGTGGGGRSVPTARLPLVLLVWGPRRVTPVTVTSLKITETAFDELLNPIHATVDLGLTVLRPDDPALASEAFARGAATYYQASREEKAVLQLAQTPELAQIPSGFDTSASGVGLPIGVPF